MESTKTGLQWGWYGFADMESAILYDMLALRESIFVVEQKCIYLELDGLDKTALHLTASEDGKIRACLRVLPPTERDSRVRIGRVAVLPEWRGQGIARMMLQMAISKAQEEYPSSGIYLEAQTYLKAFYESLGFEDCGPEFLEDGIPHIPMEMCERRPAAIV